MIREHFKGIGVLYRKGHPVANGRYDIASNGVTSAEGWLTVVRGDKPMVNTGETLLLQLEDGQQMTVVADNQQVSGSRVSVTVRYHVLIDVDSYLGSHEIGSDV